MSSRLDGDVPRGIVVGVAEGLQGDAAMRYAAEEARARHVPVTLVRAWVPVPVYDAAMLLADDDVRQAETALLESAQDRFEQIAPDVACEGRLVRDVPDRALVGLSRRAQLVVLGCHSGSTAWLGPVLGRVVTHAHCPVVAVPPGRTPGRERVVVGADGSDVSSAAIGFAFAQADLWGARLTAVLAVPAVFDAYVPDARVLAHLRERGDCELAEQLAGWSELYPDVPVQRVTSLEGPLSALLGAADGADLLVVGSHGRGAVGRTVLGSVSGSLLRSATCPLAVVRSAGRPARRSHAPAHASS